MEWSGNEAFIGLEDSQVPLITPDPLAVSISPYSLPPSTMSTPMPSLEPFLNPDVYLNHLPPEGANNYEISRDVTFVILGLMLWDILVYLEDDIKIIRRGRIRAPILCFIFARVFATAYIFASSVQLTSSVDSQATLLYGALTLCALAIGCSSFLFLRRVQAVYADHKYIRWFFSVLWLICFVCEAFILIEISPSNIPGTKRFQDTGAKPTFTISMYAVVVFDTCVFLAISYKLAQTFVAQRRAVDLTSGGRHWSSDVNESGAATSSGLAWWGRAISGRALPRLSRAIIQGGQQYYLFTVVIMITAVILLLIPTVHPIIKGTVVIPVVPLNASMACRVYRNLKQFDHRHADSEMNTKDLLFSV